MNRQLMTRLLYVHYYFRYINHVSNTVSLFNMTAKTEGNKFKEQLSALAIIRCANRYRDETDSAKLDLYMRGIVNKKCMEYIMNGCKKNYLPLLLRGERRHYIIYFLKRVLQLCPGDYIYLKRKGGPLAVLNSIVKK